MQRKVTHKQTEQTTSTQRGKDASRRSEVAKPLPPPVPVLEVRVSPELEIKEPPEMPSDLQEREDTLKPFSVERRHPAPSLHWRERRKLAQQEMEGGLARFFNSLIDSVATLIEGGITLISEPVKALVPALLGAALLPILGPVAAGALAIGVAAAMTSVPEDTLEKLVKPLREEQFNESEPQDEGVKQHLTEATLARVIREVLSEDRQANEDLAQFFKRIAPLIQKAEATTQVQISGPVHGQIVGDQNTVTQQFGSSFLRRSES